MSVAINMFLRQVIMTNGVPFDITIKNYNKETLKAFEEAEKIAKDNSVKSINTKSELKAFLMKYSVKLTTQFKEMKKTS